MVASEGWPWLIALAVCWGLVYRFWGLGPAWPVAVIGFLLFLLFRDPGRSVPPLPLGVLAPTDGRVVEVITGESPELPGQWTCIKIRNNHFGAYTVRSPIEGSVKDVRNIHEEHDRAGPKGLWVRSEEQDDVVLLFPGAGSWRSPKAFIGYGERLGQGQRFAFLRLAPVAAVYLPATAVTRVHPGDPVTAGMSVLADLAS